MNTSRIRNFSIIAHIDHGKTTLTDRLLELTNTVSKRELSDRVMDSNPIEQERGITIKLAPVRMEYFKAQSLKSEVVTQKFQTSNIKNQTNFKTQNTKHKTQNYILNLIDTPGHVDFGYEVSRSLAACEGALLLVDATQGVQAQTLSNYFKARALGLTIIPVINKIDLPSADVDGCILELIEMLDIDETEIIQVSAKTGENIDLLLRQIVKKIPPPAGDIQAELRALVFTSYYDQHKGVIAYVRVVDGILKSSNLHLWATHLDLDAVELGIFSPKMKPKDQLLTGEVGYVATGLKTVSQVKVGDTLTTKNAIIKPLPGYKEPQLMVFMDIYPLDGKDFSLLVEAMEKLCLADAALKFEKVHSLALGNGLRVGFLGILHGEIVRERLEREFGLALIATSPSVPYELEFSDGRVKKIHHAGEFPDPSLIKLIKEPITKATIFTPKAYVGGIMQLSESSRGSLQEMVEVGERVKMIYTIPLAELIVGFHDALKSISSGFASLEYELIGYRAVDAVRLDILIQKEAVLALSQIVVRDKAVVIGKKIVKKLKTVIPRQQFEIPIQAAIGGKILARETVKAFRKDVTAKLYGGDITRRKKLLEKQKKGKKRMKEIGRVTLNQEAFLAVLER